MSHALADASATFRWVYTFGNAAAIFAHLPVLDRLRRQRPCCSSSSSSRRGRGVRWASRSEASKPKASEIESLLVQRWRSIGAAPMTQHAVTSVKAQLSASELLRATPSPGTHPILRNRIPLATGRETLRLRRDTRQSSDNGCGARLAAPGRHLPGPPRHPRRHQAGRRCVVAVDMVQAEEPTC